MNSRNTQLKPQLLALIEQCLDNIAILDAKINHQQIEINELRRNIEYDHDGDNGLGV